MTWLQSLKGFRTYLILERSLSENSLEAYLRDVSKLQQYIELKGYNFLPADVPPKIISELLSWLSELGLEAASQARTLSGIKTFYRYLLIEDLINVSPADLIDAPKIGQKIPDILSVDEIDRIFAAVDLSSKNGQRNRAMLEVLYASGLRVTELTTLKISNLYFEEGYITVIGKGNKERLVPIGNDAVKHVLFYLQTVRVHIKTSPENENFVFLNNRGKPLSRVWIFLIIKELVEAAEINKNVSPHTFRHSFATHLVEGGADLKVVQDLLGHESITTTEIYTHLDTDYLRETIMMFHPRNKRK